MAQPALCSLQRSESCSEFLRTGDSVDELFEPLVLPLKANRHTNIELDFTEKTAQAYRRQVYSFDDIDVILLEGIYLLKRRFQHMYDLSIWIDCTFETALERAMKRSQERLPPDEVTRAYKTIYFPAQEIHFEVDHPQQAASIVFRNDPRIVNSGVEAAIQPPEALRQL